MDRRTTVEHVGVPRSKLQLALSHVRVERLPEGGYLCLGAIAHPDLSEAAQIGSYVPLSRTAALEAALALAARFKLLHVIVVDD